MVSKKQHIHPNWKRLHRVYGITEATYTRMLRGQNGRCFICHRDPRALIKKYRHNLCVDHCHSTGEIRGLLCKNCNTMISRWLRDDPVMVDRVKKYLTRRRTYGKVPKQT